MNWVYAVLIGLAVTTWLAYEQSRPQRTWRKPRPAWGRALALIVVVGVSGALAWAMLATAPPPETGRGPVAATPEPEDPLSARLLIPDLGLETDIIRVPLAGDTWDISRLSAQVGWLEGTGAAPGGELAIGLIGHVTLTALERGPFADLWTLQPVAEVIYRTPSRDYIYAVETIDKVKPDDAAALTSRDGDHLLLVTCANWNYLTERYSRRLLVDAVLVRSEARAR